jgi:2-methylcitrate dehydratase PrpD
MNGAQVRNVWPAAAAMNGMMAAQWVECGISGLSSSNFDVFDVVGFVADPSQLRNDLGKDWAITHGYTRMHACHLFSSALVECLLELRPDIIAKAGLNDISRIEIETHPDSIALTDRDPQTTLAARFSLPHLAATVLTHGHARPDAFSTASLGEAGIKRLRSKVLVKPFEMANAKGQHWPSAVHIHAGAQRFSAVRTEARGGHGSSPFTRDETLGKIGDLTRDIYPKFAATFARLASLDNGLLALQGSKFFQNATAVT